MHIMGWIDIEFEKRHIFPPDLSLKSEKCFFLSQK